MAKREKTTGRGQSLSSLKNKWARMTTEELKATKDDSWPLEVAFAWREALERRPESLEKQYRRFIDLRCPDGPRIRHPLLDTIYDAKRSAYVNWVIPRLERCLSELIARGEWVSVMILHKEPFWLRALVKYADKMDDKSYWQSLEMVWTMWEQMFPHKKVFLSLFQARRSQRQYLMNAGERRALMNMPKEFTVYRGFIGNRGEGLSWTIDRSKAEWFACRFAMLHDRGSPRICEGRVKKKDVLAYFNGRKEKEIVVDPAKVFSVTTHTVARSEDEEAL